MIKTRSASGSWPLMMAWLGLAVSAGCGNSAPAIRQIHGTVKLDGQPVHHGSLAFTPMGGAGTTGNPGRAMSFNFGNGKYDTRPAGVTAGDSEISLAVPQLGDYVIADPEHLTPADSLKVMGSPTKAYTKKFNLDKDEFNLEFASSDEAAAGSIAKPPEDQAQPGGGGGGAIGDPE